MNRSSNCAPRRRQALQLGALIAMLAVACCGCRTTPEPDLESAFENLRRGLALALGGEIETPEMRPWKQGDDRVKREHFSVRGPRSGESWKQLAGVSHQVFFQHPDTEAMPGMTLYALRVEHRGEFGDQRILQEAVRQGLAMDEFAPPVPSDRRTIAVGEVDFVLPLRAFPTDTTRPPTQAWRHEPPAIVHDPVPAKAAIRYVMRAHEKQPPVAWRKELNVGGRLLVPAESPLGLFVAGYSILHRHDQDIV